MNQGGKVLDILVLVIVFCVAVYAVYRSEQTGLTADKNFTDRLVAVEKSAQETSKSVTQVQAAILQFDNILDKQDQLMKNVDNLAGVFAKNIENLHLDIEKTEKRIQAIDARDIKVSVAIPKQPFVVDLLPSNQQRKTVTRTNVTKTKTGYVKESVSKSGFMLKTKPKRVIHDPKKTMKAMDL
jgi:septal ring factor EnvC (AmiA/AmiB activator)